MKDFKAVMLAGAFAGWITSEMLPAIQIWLPMAILAGAVVFAAQRVKA